VTRVTFSCRQKSTVKKGNTRCSGVAEALGGAFLPEYCTPDRTQFQGLQNDVGAQYEFGANVGLRDAGRRQSRTNSIE
jgi:hypothetical protein